LWASAPSGLVPSIDDQPITAARLPWQNQHAFWGGAAMPRLSRRDFLISSSALTLTATAPARGAMGPNDKFDLVIKGGDVLDPSQYTTSFGR
jgi:hypothetical protein